MAGTFLPSISLLWSVSAMPNVDQLTQSERHMGDIPYREPWHLTVKQLGGSVLEADFSLYSPATKSSRRMHCRCAYLDLFGTTTFPILSWWRQAVYYHFKCPPLALVAQTGIGEEKGKARIREAVVGSKNLQLLLHANTKELSAKHRPHSSPEFTGSKLSYSGSCRDIVSETWRH